ncbi:unnamed protein product [Darwinula stevensoni]|uniref:ISXO2-like transposase domain-containing protein n=1 Tax=Darwinula stevensoni TaxID=69355 RepID=A0A7R9ABV5_9CRUS|nr:unnamed protein product [Darwinula stevensoni]CAG0899595.1 unnamed protein product [Darwinula stevensoni]
MQSEETTIAWCRGNGLLPCAADQEQPPPCLKAGCSGTLRDATKDRLGRPCSKLPIRVILALAWTWAYDITITKSKLMLAGELSSLRNETFIDWRHFAREILQVLFANARPMGGPGEVIQIDESYFRARRKNNKGRLMQGNAVPSAWENYGDVVDGPWVFGMAWRHDGHTELRLLHVQRRDRATLLPIIRQHIAPGTEIWSDEWAAYATLSHHGYNHKTVNHQQHFVDPVSGCNTQMIESHWASVKARIQTRGRGTTSKMLQMHLIEAWWRSVHDAPRPFLDFLDAIKSVYPQK